MSKDAYYFSHDANARNDPKIIQMLSVYKAEGYGWYWMLIEMMREQENYRLSIKSKYAVNAYARELDADAERLQQYIDDCVNEFTCDGKGIFDKNDEYLWSESLLRRMKIKDGIAEKARQAALIRWGKVEDEAETSESIASASEINASVMQRKERKVKEKKERKRKENKGATTIAGHEVEVNWLIDLNQEFVEIDFYQELKKFEDYWTGGRRKLKNVRLALRKWMIKAMEFFKEKHPGTDTKFTKGKYGHMVATTAADLERLRTERARRNQ